MPHDDWLKDLYRLAERARGLGITADMPSMDIVELWGLYCFLKRFCEGEQ